MYWTDGTNTLRPWYHLFPNASLPLRPTSNSVTPSPEFGFAAFTGVLPADQADEVVDAGVGDGDDGHGVHFLLSHRQVDVDLLGSRCADVTLRGRKRRRAKKMRRESCCSYSVWLGYPRRGQTVARKSCAAYQRSLVQPNKLS